MALADTFDSLRAGFRGPLVGPDDAEYDEARAVWNAMIDKRPAAIVRCSGPADVVAAVNFARERGLLDRSPRRRPQCGGEGHVRRRTCHRSVRDAGDPGRPAARRVRAQGGVTWGEFDHETQAHGLATPGGVISTTGIAGLTLGGGFGWLTRRFGLSCDNLLSVDLVTAAGEQIVCSEDSNPDVFWALRGGGGNFGVATSFEYQLHPVGPIILGGLIGWPLEQAADVLAFHREQTRSAPDELGVSSAFVTAPPLPFVPESLHFKPAIVVIFCWSGDVDEGREVVRPWLDLAPPIQMVEAMPYTMMNSIQDDARAARPPQLLEGRVSRRVHRRRDRGRSRRSQRACRRRSAWPRSCLWGGAIGRVGADDSAFGQRDGAVPVQRDLDVGGPERSRRERLRGRGEFYDVMQPYATDGVYVNFLSEEGDERIEAAYGRQVCTAGPGQGPLRPREPLPSQPEHPSRRVAALALLIVLPVAAGPVAVLSNRLTGRVKVLSFTVVLVGAAITSSAPPAPDGLPGVVSAPARGPLPRQLCAAPPVGGLPIAHGKIS